MDEQNYNSYDPWEDGAYGTGRTEPPKNRGGLMALLLILVIFLSGIITVLGILNVKLFHQLRQQEDNTISFVAEEQTQPTDAIQEEVPEITAYTEQESLPGVSMDLHTSPASIDNFSHDGGISLQEIYQKNIPSVVSIICNKHNGNTTGTGVVLTENGYIVTNAHVVEDAASITIQLTDNRIFQAGLIGADEVSDLAVLFIQASDLIPAEFGDSTDLRVGDSVTAIGDPLGVEFRGTMTDGIVSAINRDMTVEGRTMTLIQTNAALNSGNSGGPLINCFGQVIGINTMKIGAFTDAAGVEGLGFAIPSATVKDIVDQIISQGYVSGRPTMGIAGESLSTFYQHYYHLPAGLYITQVESGSYADYYGIEVGDILLSANDERITNMDQLNAFLYRHEVGDIVTVTIYRGGMTADVDLTLTEARG